MISAFRIASSDICRGAARAAGTTGTETGGGFGIEAVTGGAETFLGFFGAGVAGADIGACCGTGLSAGTGGFLVGDPTD